MRFLLDFIAQLRSNLGTMPLRIREFLSRAQVKESKSTALKFFNSTIRGILIALVATIVAVGGLGLEDSRFVKWLLIGVFALLALTIVIALYNYTYLARKDPEVLREHTIEYREVEMHRASIGDDIQGEIIEDRAMLRKLPAEDPEDK